MLDDKRDVHHFQQPQGEGVGVVLADAGTFDTSHFEFQEASIEVLDPLSTDQSSHASVNATIIVGDGRRDFIKGLAPAARLYLANKNVLIDGILPMRIGNYLPAHPDIRVTANTYEWHTNSNTGKYTSSSKLVDEACDQYPHILHVVPSGGGTQGGVHDLGMAKNVLTVGQCVWNKDLQMPVRGGFGQYHTASGVFKPEIMALRDHRGATYQDKGYIKRSGNSQSVATVAGAACLVYEALQKIAQLSEPPAALVKAILCCSADLMGNVAQPNPKRTDSRWGFGSLNIGRALQIVRDGRFNIVNILAGEQPVSGLPEEHLKVVLAWHDPASANLADPYVHKSELRKNGQSASPFANIQLQTRAPGDNITTFGTSQPHEACLVHCPMSKDEIV